MWWGFQQWLIKDHFSCMWRFWIVPLEAYTPTHRRALPEDPLFHIVHSTFDAFRAMCDERAHDLMKIYDALTGEDFARRLSKPTHDPRRLLRGFKYELERTLSDALEDGRLQFERYEVPWPFRDDGNISSDPPPPPPPKDDIETLHALMVRLQCTIEEVRALPHVLTLTSDDAAYTQTRRVSSDGRRSMEDMVEYLFEDMSDARKYTLICTGDDVVSVLFDAVPYHELPFVVRHAPADGSLAMSNDRDDANGGDPLSDSDTPDGVVDTEA